MNHKHIIDLPIAQTTIQIEVDYSWSAGRPATREEPEEGDSFDIETVYVLGAAGQKECAPIWLIQIVEEDDDIAAQLLTAAQEDRQCAADEYADQLREERILGLHEEAVRSREAY